MEMLKQASIIGNLCENVCIVSTQNASELCHYQKVLHFTIYMQCQHSGLMQEVVWLLCSEAESKSVEDRMVDGHVPYPTFMKETGACIPLSTLTLRNHLLKLNCFPKLVVY